MSPRAFARAVAAALALGYRAGPRLLAGQVALDVASGALPVAGAYLSKLLFDEVARGTALDVRRAAWLAAGGALVALSMLAAGLLGGHLGASHRRALSLAVEDRLYRRVNQFEGLRPFEDAAFLNRLRLAEQAAVGAPAEIVGFGLTAARGAVSLAGFCGILAAAWGPMALALLAAAAPSLFAQLALARRRAAVAERGAGAMRRRFFYRSLLTDVRAAKEIRLFGLGAFFHRRMQDIARAANDVEARVERREAAAQLALSLLGGGVAGAATVAAVVGVAEGRLTVGDLILFTSAVAGVQGALSAIVTQIGGLSADLRLFGHYADIMAKGPAPPRGGGPTPPLREGIELRDVWFRYDEGGPWVLRGVNLRIPGGRSVGLVGENGAGKSTLVKLLCRFYEPDRGEICWNGVPIGELDAGGLRRRVCAIFQDFMTYDLSAAENIGLGDVDRLDDLEATRRAARLAGVDDALAALPNGYKTLLSRVFFNEDDRERGTSLSGGQWQRVALARGLRRDDADLLILDEPSAGLDADAEHRVHGALSAHRAGRTTLLISHRLGAIREADTIAVLVDGRVAESGSHDELMAEGGEYARLFGLQASGYQARRASP